MDAINNYGLIFGVVVAVLSAGFSFFNRERYKTLIKDIYQPGNDELRSQLGTARSENQELEKSCAEVTAKYDEQSKYVKKLEELNLRPTAFTELTKVISNNHKEMMGKLTDLATTIVEKKRGK
jgi:hypothetical protein